MDRKNLGILAIVLVVIGFAGATFYFFTQGTFLTPPQDCEWGTPTHPDTGEQFTSISEFKQVVTDKVGMNSTQWQGYNQSIDTRFKDVDQDGVKELQIKGKTCIKGKQSGSA